MRTQEKSKLPVEPLAHEPLHERMYASLRQAIMAGQFMPGQKLTVRGVAQAYGTSPMPVRASLSRLVAEGGLEQQAKGTIIVPRVDKETFTEIMELRALLERRATLKATPNIKKGALSKLHKASIVLRKASQGDDIIAYLEANRKLKFCVYAHSRNPALTALIENLLLKAGPLLRHLSSDLNGIMKINYHDEALIELRRAVPAPRRMPCRRISLLG